MIEGCMNDFLIEAAPFIGASTANNFVKVNNDEEMNSKYLDSTLT